MKIASTAPAVKWIQRLYVAGQTTKSLQAFANIGKICKMYLEGRQYGEGAGWVNGHPDGCNQHEKVRGTTV